MNGYFVALLYHVLFCERGKQEPLGLRIVPHDKEEAQVKVKIKLSSHIIYLSNHKLANGIGYGKRKLMI